MANHPAIVSLTILDELGVKANLFANTIVTDATTVANMETFIQEWVTVTDAIIDGQIVRATMKIDLDYSGAKSAPVAGSRVEQTGLFNFEQASSGYKYGIDVPSISNSVIVGGKLNLSDASIANWKNFVVTGLATITFAGRVVNALLALLDALLTFRKKRKQLDARSFEEAT